MRTPIALPLDDLNHRIHQSFKVWVSQELPFEPVWYWQVHWRNRLLSVSICLLISQLTRQLRPEVSFSCVGFKCCAVVSEPDTRKIKKGLVCACRRTSDWLLIAFSDVRLLEMLLNRTRTVFAFLLRFRHCYVSSDCHSNLTNFCKFSLSCEQVMPAFLL